MSDAATGVTFGLENLLDRQRESLKDVRFGLLANMGSVTPDLRYSWDVLAGAFPGQLAALFSPQHGLWGEQQANMVESRHSRHAPLGIPVYSLYADSRVPTQEMLAGIDCLVIDLQDVGTRVYTFAWTASYCLQECAAAGLTVYVLDRPNPIGGTIVEGPPLLPEYRSFVGLASIPMRHGLTLGELLLLINSEQGINADLHVVPVSGWSRAMTWSDLSRPWTLPSPNVPRIEGVQVYPGQVLLEGTNLSEGRGTTMPFEWCGAPFVEPHRLLDELERFALPGVTFRPARFIPTFDKWQGESCGGLALHITDTETFRPYRTSVAILAACQRFWPGQFEWLLPPYEYETEKMPIDIIDGRSRLREAIDMSVADQNFDPASLDEWDRSAWQQRVAPFLIYT